MTPGLGRRPRPAADGKPSPHPPGAAGGGPAPVPAAPRPRRRLGDRLGLYELAEPTITTTTRQAETLNPALVASDPQLVGSVYGIDTATGQVSYLDVHGLYTAGRITSPVVLIAGAVGSGKSSLAKTVYAARPLSLGDQVAVFDKKDQAGQGEYARLAGLVGGTVVRFDRAGGTVVNLLDPAIVTAAGAAGVGQDTLLLLVAELAVGRPLTPRERHATLAGLHAARRTAREQGRVAVLSDVIAAMYAPAEAALPSQAARAHGLDAATVFGWGLDVALALGRFLDGDGDGGGDLSGLVDGPTSADVDWTADLLVFDISALDEGSVAIPVVMAVVNTFLMAVWAARPGRRRKLVIEEGYHTVAHPSVARIMRANAKRGRGSGVAVVTCLHHLSDVPATSEAVSLIQEAGVVHLYSQDKEADAAAAVRYFGLPAEAADLLMVGLDRGTALVKIGAEAPRTVAHLRSTAEEWLTDTDTAMRGDVASEALPGHLAAAPDRGGEAAGGSRPDAHLDAPLAGGGEAAGGCDPVPPADLAGVPIGSGGTS